MTFKLVMLITSAIPMVFEIYKLVVIKQYSFASQMILANPKMKQGDYLAIFVDQPVAFMLSQIFYGIWLLTGLIAFGLISKEGNNLLSEHIVPLFGVLWLFTFFGDVYRQYLIYNLIDGICCIGAIGLIMFLLFKDLTGNPVQF